MKFVVSYSCGKDSTLALHRMVALGHEPVALLVMVNSDLDRSWFHGVDITLLKAISSSMQIPLIQCPSSGEEYHTALENGLKEALAMGAQCCVFGDVDIEDNAAWCKARCDAVGIPYQFPLWQESREQLTRECITLGYTALIKCVRNADLPQNLLGKPLDEAAITLMKSKGIDVCGENGEYHTLVVDGPLFQQKLNVECREILDFGNISAINIVAKK